MIHSHDTVIHRHHTIIFETSKIVFPGTCFRFDICNPKLFALKNRSSIVPSLQNIQNMSFLMALMSKNTFSEKCRKSILTGVKIRKKLRWIQICNPFWLKPSKMTRFWYIFFCIFIFLYFGIWQHKFIWWTCDKGAIIIN